MILRVAPCDNFNDSTARSRLPVNQKGIPVVVEKQAEA